MSGRLKLTVSVGLALTLAVSFLFPGEHPHFFWERYPFFDALFAAAGAVVIIIVARFFGKSLLQRQEDYYER